MTPAPANAHNYGSRCGRVVDLLVIHTMEGRMEPTLELFASAGAGVSAHYCVGADGAVFQCVGDDYAAFHAGNAEFNHRSIGVELEGFAADPRPDAQLSALGGLVAELCTAHGIPLDREHVIGHCEVPDPRDPSKLGGTHHHTDPGPDFPWGRLIAEAQQLTT